MASLASKLISSKLISPEATSTPARSRVKKASSKMEELAAQFHELNASANAAKRAADKARESLYAEMKAAGVNSFQTMAATDKGSVLVEATIKAPLRRVIDVVQLAELISPEVLLKVVSATQKSVTEHCGSNIVLQCSKEEAGEENVSVTLVK